jgi:hypothetical protein
MRRIFNKVIASVLLMTIATATAFAGKISNKWSSVKKEVGSNAFVLTKSGKGYEDKLEVVNDNYLLMKVKGDVVKINRDDVAEVWVNKMSIRKEVLFALGFAGAGLLAGTLIGGYAGSSSQGLGPARPLIGGAVGAAGGAIGGAFLGRSLEKEVKRVMIYQAP